MKEESKIVVEEETHQEKEMLNHIARIEVDSTNQESMVLSFHYAFTNYVDNNDFIEVR